MTPTTETVPPERGCDAHAYHAPPPAYLELHHVVPRDWQSAWRPPGAPGAVWLPILAALCRTGHGNVHFILTRLMHHWALLKDLDQAEAAAVADLRGAGLSVGRTERQIARRGPDLWVAHGGDLQLLVDAGCYGEI